jgi:pyridoxal phosphate enzyme (YggS family)
MTKLQVIKSHIKEIAVTFGRQEEIALLAVTKNQKISTIESALAQGHRLFGENRVQEAYTKWPEMKKKFNHIELHLIGHLQTNKVKEAIKLFDVIQTLDSLKLAEKLVAEEKRQGKHLAYLIEVNIGEEPQKAGVLPKDFDDFFSKISTCYPLNVQGIMCIPPAEQDPTLYFQRMKNISETYKFPIISMGMSNDYELAIRYGATQVRIGRALF